MTEHGLTGKDVQVTRLVRVAAVAWCGALVAGPVLVSQPSGSRWHPIGLVVYGVAQWVCHQRIDRSFQFGGVPLPVCARCAGIYAGAAIVALATAAGPRPRGAVTAGPAWPGAWGRWVLLTGAAPTALSVAWEWTSGVPLSNPVRAVAGGLLGMAAAWVLFVASPHHSSHAPTSGAAGPDRMG